MMQLQAQAGAVLLLSAMMKSYFVVSLHFTHQFFPVLLCVFAVVATVVMYRKWYRHLKFPKPVSVRQEALTDPSSSFFPSSAVS